MAADDVVDAQSPRQSPVIWLLSTPAANGAFKLAQLVAGGVLLRTSLIPACHHNRHPGSPAPGLPRGPSVYARRSLLARWRFCTSRRWRARRSNINTATERRAGQDPGGRLVSTPGRSLTIAPRTASVQAGVTTWNRVRRHRRQEFLDHGRDKIAALRPGPSMTDWDTGAKKEASKADAGKEGSKSRKAAAGATVACYRAGRRRQERGPGS